MHCTTCEAEKGEKREERRDEEGEGGEGKRAMHGAVVVLLYMAVARLALVGDKEPTSKWFTPAMPVPVCPPPTKCRHGNTVMIMALVVFAR